MKLFGHIVRRGGLERQIIEGKMEGKGGRGQPQTSWLTDIKQFTGGSIAESGWNALVKTTAALCPNWPRESERDSALSKNSDPNLGVVSRGYCKLNA